VGFKRLISILVSILKHCMRIYGHKLITCKNGNLDVITLNGILIPTLTYDSHAVKTLLLIGVKECWLLSPSRQNFCVPNILVEWQFFVSTAVSLDVT
jgi:hypothetical protein